MSTPHMSESQSDPNRCNWCEGEKVRGYYWAYAPGPDPFTFRDIISATRVGPCRNCRGTGGYDPARDPTLDHPRRSE